MSSKVDEDLKHIPKGVGGSAQNRLRYYYEVYREIDIIEKTKEETLERAIVATKKDYPDFVPQYDKDYFKL